MINKFVRYWIEYDVTAQVRKFYVETHSATATYYYLRGALDYAATAARHYGVVPQGDRTHFRNRGEGQRTWWIDCPPPVPGPLP